MKNKLQIMKRGGQILFGNQSTVFVWKRYPEILYTFPVVGHIANVDIISGYLYISFLIWTYGKDTLICF